MFFISTIKFSKDLKGDISLSPEKLDEIPEPFADSGEDELYEPNLNKLNFDFLSFSWVFYTVA
jgi:hypothetical protein